MNLSPLLKSILRKENIYGNEEFYRFPTKR
jgi:hypothetical protein